MPDLTRPLCRSFSTNRTREFWLASYVIVLPGRGKNSSLPSKWWFEARGATWLLWRLVLLSRQSLTVPRNSIYLPLKRKSFSTKKVLSLDGTKAERLPSHSLGPAASRKVAPSKQQQTDLRPDVMESSMYGLRRGTGGLCLWAPCHSPSLKPLFKVGPQVGGAKPRLQ